MRMTGENRTDVQKLQTRSGRMQVSKGIANLAEMVHQRTTEMNNWRRCYIQRGENQVFRTCVVSLWEEDISICS